MASNGSNIAPGDLCILQDDGQPWPVVVWRISMVPTSMLSSRLTAHNLPVLLLGRYELRWAPQSELESYLPPEKDQLPENAVYLLEAHREAAQFHELGYYEARWGDVCLARKLEEQHEAEIAKKKASSIPRKRKLTQKPVEPKEDVGKLPTRYERFISSLATPKREPDLYETSDEDSDTLDSEKKSKSNPGEMLKPSDGFVSIRVGSNPIIISRVPLNRIQQYPFLDNIKQREEDGQWYISRSPFFEFNIRDFDPVAEFLRGGEYRPRLVDDGTHQAALEDVNTAEAVKREVFRCGSTFQYAGRIKMHDLQRLAVRKLRVINQYPSEEILHVAKIVYAHTPADSDPEATAAIRDLLECHIANNFWRIADTELVTLTRIMEEHADLAQMVFAKRVEMAEQQQKAPVDVL